MTAHTLIRVRENKAVPGGGYSMIMVTPQNITFHVLCEKESCPLDRCSLHKIV